MQILDKNTVLVSTSDELKTVLEEENTYTYIYFNNDITITSSILINEKKKYITIDGTYQNIRYTYNSIANDDSSNFITASKENKIITIKSMDIINTNTYGIIYVPGSTDYNKVTTKYIDISLKGTKMLYNPYGITVIMDSIITIEPTNGINSELVADASNLKIGGSTYIESKTTDKHMFYFRTTSSITFLPNSYVTITTDTREFMNGTANLNFTIKHDTIVNLTTGNGFAAHTKHGAGNVLIEKRATLNFIEKSHQRIPMWVIYNSLTMEEDSNLFVINSYASTPSDNYNIHFKGTNPKITLNNPNNLTMYTKNANCIYTDNPVEFTFKMKRFNLWTNSTELAIAGSISNPPDFSWYKENELTEVTGTITTTSTTINSHNFTSDELNNLPSLDNFSFQNKKQLSIGSNYLNIHPINNSTNIISGHTSSFADVSIKYNNSENIVSADENGYFYLDLENPIDDQTEINITTLGDSFIFSERIITTPHTGELSIKDITNNLSFSLTPISLNSIILPKNKDISIDIVDSRETFTNWNLYVKCTNAPTSSNNFKLENSLIFKKLDDEIVKITKDPTLVYTETSTTNGFLKTLVWSKEKGPLLNLDENSLEINEEYISELIWSID